MAKLKLCHSLTTVVSRMRNNFAKADLIHSFDFAFNLKTQESIATNQNKSNGQSGFLLRLYIQTMHFAALKVRQKSSAREARVGRFNPYYNNFVHKLFQVQTFPIGHVGTFH
jgi:hypothetical protein